jgi:hypothetical protein
MQILIIEKDKDPGHGPMYVSIMDPGTYSDRTLYISDERGGSIELKNEEIGELYKALKPPLAGK